MPHRRGHRLVHRHGRLPLCGGGIPHNPRGIRRVWRIVSIAASRPSRESRGSFKPLWLPRDSPFSCATQPVSDPVDTVHCNTIRSQHSTAQHLHDMRLERATCTPPPDSALHCIALTLVVHQHCSDVAPPRDVALPCTPTPSALHHHHPTSRKDGQRRVGRVEAGQGGEGGRAGRGAAPDRPTCTHGPKECVTHDERTSKVFALIANNNSFEHQDAPSNARTATDARAGGSARTPDRPRAGQHWTDTPDTRGPSNPHTTRKETQRYLIQSQAQGMRYVRVGNAQYRAGRAGNTPQERVGGSIYLE